MKQYLDLCERILSEGTRKSNRTGTDTISIFGHQMCFDLSKGFPLITTKKMHLKSIIHELIWFISGSSNIKYLKDNGVTIWDEWADENGELGPVYGVQWRKWLAVDGSPEKGFINPGFKSIKFIDQLDWLQNEIRRNPDNRRLILSAWNVGEIDKMALPPCHCFAQFYVVDGKLSCQMYQRSCDTFLGVPFNIASYALFTMMMAHVTGLQPGNFIHTLGDAHFYVNHLAQINLQLTREPRELPTMYINPMVKSIFDFKYTDFMLEGYNPHPTIKGDISV